MNQSSLILGPIGAGKTRYLIETIYEHKQRDTNLPIWLLFPDTAHKRRFQERLFSQLAEGSALFAVETFVFDSLSQRLLDLCGSDIRVMSAVLRQTWMKSVLQRLKLAGRLEYFGKIVDKRGFREEIALLIDEFSQQQISPELFSAQVASKKDQELALIFSAVQQDMADHRLIDRLGAGRLALAELQENAIQRTVPLFLVDGFEHFTPLQADLIAAVAQTTEKTFITLTQAAAQGEGSHPLPFERLKISSDRLMKAFQQKGLALNKTSLAQTKPDRRPPIIQHLAHNLFRSDPQQRPADESIAWIVSPNEEHEVRTVLKRVKQQLLTAAVEPEQVVLALTSAQRYLPLIEGIAREYSIPLDIQIRQPLLQNPLIQAVLQFIRLASGKCTGDQLLQLIRSPYMKPELMDDASLLYLQQVCNRVRAEITFEQWQQRMEDEASEGCPVEGLQDIQSRTMACLRPYFAAIEKLGKSSRETIAERLIETFALAEPANESLLGLKERCQALEQELPAHYSFDRDEIALSRLVEVLESLRVSAEMFASEAIFQPSFAWVLEELLQDQSIQSQPLFQNAVTITTLFAARGMNLEHCYVLGLSEANLSAPEVGSCWLLRAEREYLRERGLPLQLDQEGLHVHEVLHQVCAATRETLTLSRAAQVEGMPTSASAFWNAVEDCFSDSSFAARTSYYELGDEANRSNCASEIELLNAWFSKRSQGQIPVKLQSWVYHHPERKKRWQFVEQAVALDEQRQRKQPPHSFNGRLLLPSTRDEVLRELNEDYVWSVSQLNELVRCGYRFFAKRILDLAPPPPDEESLESLFFGDLIHQALFALYEPFRREKIPIAPGNRDLALASLAEIVETLFENGASRYIQLQERWQPSLMQPLREYITGFLRRIIEADFSNPSPFHKWGNAPRMVTHLEHSFHVTMDLNDAPSYPFHLRGTIDRIDRLGDRYIIIDYKSGLHRLTRNELAQGLDLQLPLYLLAQQKSQGSQIVPQYIALYWHLRNCQTSTVIDGKNAAPLLMNIQRLVHERLLLAASGDFSNKPTKPVANRCVRYCEYYELCRLARMIQHSPS
ncbi:MAG: PD-(D/E)XK nuclease family protein [Anaerolineaceae bacterium]|nr:PD-(D/E)XK nuclease family protein [Anaerolineaceae bacterium]